MWQGELSTFTSRNTSRNASRNASSWVCQVDSDGRKEMSSLSLKTIVVYFSMTSLIIETNLQKEGLVHRVPCVKSREKLQKLFQSACVLFVNTNTVTYLNLFACPFKQRDMSVMASVPDFIL